MQVLQNVRKSSARVGQKNNALIDSVVVLYGVYQRQWCSGPQARNFAEIRLAFRAGSWPGSEAPSVIRE
jgi:hypothetical protein